MQAESLQEKNKCNILLWSQFFKLILWRKILIQESELSHQGGVLWLFQVKNPNAILHGKSKLNCALYFCLGNSVYFNVLNWNSRASLHTEWVHFLYKHFSGCFAPLLDKLSETQEQNHARIPLRHPQVEGSSHWDRWDQPILQLEWFWNSSATKLMPSPGSSELRT